MREVVSDVRGAGLIVGATLYAGFVRGQVLAFAPALRAFGKREALKKMDRDGGWEIAFCSGTEPAIRERQ